MKKTNNNTPSQSLGEELLIEASSLLFEDIDKIADEISPEEASEFEELRRTIMEYGKKNSGNYPVDSEYPTPMAAEGEENYQ
ncbi:MAG: hypothetical protein IKD40_01165 [Bacteroidaceae bacterium]|nr:hypothetical protein [Bacteroidaceae bacterium]